MEELSSPAKYPSAYGSAIPRQLYMRRRNPCNCNGMHASRFTPCVCYSLRQIAADRIEWEP
jgi:hypothetical protein